MDERAANEREHASVDDLRSVDLFADLDDAQLELWARAAYFREFAPGEEIETQGTLVPGLQLLLEGRARSIIRDGDAYEPVTIHVAPTWMGAIGALVGEPVPTTLEAIDHCRTALIPTETFEELVLGSAVVHRRIMRVLRVVTGRVARIEGQRERYAALGTAAAGLSHELGNPASAAGRAAAQLHDILPTVISSVSTLAGMTLGGERGHALQQLVARSLSEEPVTLSPLALADQEEIVSDRLTELGVDVPGGAEAIARLGGERWLDAIIGASDDATGSVVAAVAAVLSTHAVADEISAAAKRVTELVATMRSYAQLDRGSTVPVDVNEGIDSALIVALGSKPETVSVKIVRHYGEDLPALMAFGPDLNLVWTNLIANAIEAIDDDGTITIRTRREDACVRVDIVDTGRGIALEHRGRIFDWFFTTKEIGAGAGLGLSVARRIVVDSHGGSIAAESRPGEGTTVTVWIPTAATAP